MEFIICEKGHKRTEGASCPACDFPPNVGQGVGGGPKVKKKVCRRCLHTGLAKKNSGGNSANCANCNWRFGSYHTGWGDKEPLLS